jgi:putative ABC transport system permease protein
MKDLFRFSLRTLPRRFRDKYGREMELDFEETWRERRGVFARLRVVVLALVDILRLRWRLCRADRRRPIARRSSSMEPFFLDGKLALRALGKRWSFALLGMLTLAMGIGAVTAVFSVVKGVLLSPLPYEDSERIVILWHDLGNGAQSLPALNPLDLFDYRERAELFDDWTLATGFERILGADEEPELVDVGFVEANFFSFFGIEPLYGRSFTKEEDAPSGSRVAILSHRLWTRRFGSDPGVIGETVRLGGADCEIVGVLPATFRLLLPPEAFRLRDAEIWFPTQIDRNRLPPRNYTGFTGFGKVRPGVSFEQAQQEMDRLEAELKEEHAVHEAANLQVRAVPLHGDVVKRARPNLTLLLFAVGFVLLIACGNTAQLLLARWRGGERELAVRAAMGASRWRLSRLVGIESLILALGAGGLGVLFALAGLSFLPRFAESSLPRLDEVAIDRGVLAFAFLTSIVSAFAFSIVPAISLSKSNLALAMAEAGRSSSSRRQTRLRSALIVFEVSVSVMLLVATGLTVRSFAALLEAEPGFESKGLLTLRLSLPQPAYQGEEEREAFYHELLRRVSSLPGVLSVAAVNQLPLTGSGTLQPYAYDEETARNWESVTADERYVSAGYFGTMGTTLLGGREFTEDDTRIGGLGRRVAIIDESLAEKAFPGRDAVGQLLRVEPLGHEDPFTEIVGVAEHQRLHDLTRRLLPQIFFPGGQWWSVSLVVRTASDPAVLVAPLRAQIDAVAKGVAVEDVASMDAIVRAARAPARLSLVLMMGFGVFAALLSAVGLFGVVSYTVSLRSVELSIRLALGATPVEIRRTVLGQGALLVTLALGIGLGGAALLGRFLSGLLYGVSPVDPVTYAGVAALLALVALVACWVPARRATHVDPARVLNGETR